jgi:thymidylate synthase
MKPRETTKNEETSPQHRPSSAGETRNDEVGRPMRILIAIQGYYGERIVENIRHHCPPNWEVNQITLPTGLPGIVDDADEFLPGELPVADLLISLGEDPGVAQMIPDMVRRSGARAVIAPADNRAWLPFGLARQIIQKLESMGVNMVYPVPFCALTEDDSRNPYIQEFAKHFGRPDVDTELYQDDRHRVGKVTAKREAPCGSTRFVAERLVGVWFREATEQAGLLHHQFPCLATMAMDREFEDTLMHRAGNMLKQTIQQSIKDAGLDRYSV